MSDESNICLKWLCFLTVCVAFLLFLNMLNVNNLRKSYCLGSSTCFRHINVLESVTSSHIYTHPHTPTRDSIPLAICSSSECKWSHSCGHNSQRWRLLMEADTQCLCVCVHVSFYTVHVASLSLLSLLLILILDASGDETDSVTSDHHPPALPRLFLPPI